MKSNENIFVKLNYKNIGELNSFIYNNTGMTEGNYNKYVMCAGKYDKSGWTIVFKAKSIDEAQQLMEMNSKKRSDIIKSQIIDGDKVMLPTWLQ